MSNSQEFHIFDRKPFSRLDRCVTCAQPKASHVPGQQKSYCKGYATMDLPEGKTCGDCAHIRRCNSIFGHMPADERCDWCPIRFDYFAVKALRLLPEPKRGPRKMEGDRSQGE